MERKTVTIDINTYNRIKDFSTKLGLSFSSTLRLLVNSLSIEETDEEVIVLLNTTSPFKARRLKIIDSRKYAAISRSREVRSLRAENLQLKSLVKELTNKIAKLEQSLEMVREENERLRRENRRLREMLGSGKVDLTVGEPLIVKELRDHGLLLLAKKWIICGDKELEKYVNEDAIYAIDMHRDEILTAAQVGESPKRRRLFWIF